MSELFSWECHSEESRNFAVDLDLFLGKNKRSGIKNGVFPKKKDCQKKQKKKLFF